VEKEMVVSNNVLRKVQDYYDILPDKYEKQNDAALDFIFNGYLDACEEFGFLTSEESEQIYSMLIAGGKIYDT
jgi:hypothetical protein